MEECIRKKRDRDEAYKRVTDHLKPVMHNFFLEVRPARSVCCSVLTNSHSIDSGTRTRGDGAMPAVRLHALLQLTASLVTLSGLAIATHRYPSPYRHSRRLLSANPFFF
jgi:hypothetical protein